MGKMIMYLTVTGFTLVMLYIAGLAPNTGVMLTLITNPGALQEAPVYVQFYAILIGFTGLGAITLGVFIKNYDIVFAGLLLPFIIPIFFDIISLFNLLKDYVSPYIAALIMGVPILVLLFTLVEWVRNKD